MERTTENGKSQDVQRRKVHASTRRPPRQEDDRRCGQMQHLISRTWTRPLAVRRVDAAWKAPTRPGGGRGGPEAREAAVKGRCRGGEREATIGARECGERRLVSVRAAAASVRTGRDEDAGDAMEMERAPAGGALRTGSLPFILQARRDENIPSCQRGSARSLFAYFLGCARKGPGRPLVDTARLEILVDDKRVAARGRPGRAAHHRGDHSGTRETREPSPQRLVPGRGEARAARDDRDDGIARHRMGCGRGRSIGSAGSAGMDGHRHGPGA